MTDMLTAVLNYPTGSVDLFNIPDGLNTTEEVEKYLEEDCGYKMSDIYYMVHASVNYRSDLNEKAFK